MTVVGTEAPPGNGQRPAPINTQSVAVVLEDIRDEVRLRGRFPPGDTGFSLARTRALVHDPLPILLDLYRRYGPVASVRGFHRREVMMLGPAANHFVTVTDADRFHWREGHFGDLTPLLGDGILTTDGRYHDRARRLMMPAFHHDRIEAAVEVMAEEAERGMATWADGDVIDVYSWVRRVALRIAMRSLLGLDPDDHRSGAAAADHFERALHYWGTDAWVRLMKGPRTPWARMQHARRALDEIVFAEIGKRRRRPVAGTHDVLAMLLDAEDEDGSRFADEEIRDQLVTLLFAGHDTSSAGIAFLLHELVRSPDALQRVRDEQDRVLAGSAPTAAQLHGELPELEMAMDEALRLYPPVWIGARRAVEDFEFEGVGVPAGAFVNYSPWATHRLPEVFEQPAEFRPERFTRERKAALPRGAYVPFGGGSRICIGKRFGQTVVKALTSAIVQRNELELTPGYSLQLRLEPTLSPRDGLPMVVRRR